MEFATIRELKHKTSKVIETGKSNGPVIVTRRGKPVALLRAVESGDLEIRLKPLWKRLRAAAEKNSYSGKDVNKIINNVRKAKKAK